MSLEEEGDWAGCLQKHAHPSAKFDRMFGEDRTAPSVSTGEEEIPTVYPVGSITFEETEKQSAGNKSIHRRRRPYSPLKDWRVYALLIGVALVVGISTGMAVRASSSAKNSATMGAATGTTKDMDETASGTSISSIDALFESEDESTEDDRPDTPDVEGYNDTEADNATTTIDTTSTPSTNNTTKATPSLQQDNEQEEEEEEGAQPIASASMFEIIFEIQLTISDYDAIILDTQFGEILVDATFSFLRQKVYALSSNVRTMDMTGQYTWDCHNAPCSPDSTINATFTLSVALREDVPEEEATSINSIIYQAFADQDNLQEWEMKVAAAGIVITSATVRHADSVVGTFVESDHIPSQHSTSTAAMRPTEGWAESVKLIGPKEATDLYVIDPIPMELVSESHEGSNNIKGLLDTTFSHFWDSLSSEFSSFVGLRLLVHTSTHHGNNLRSLQGTTTTTATFTARIRTSGGPEGVTLHALHAVLHSSLSGAGLEQWMASVVEHNIDIVAARTTNFGS
mmetsp:Transcript_20984/g.42844  ORF Transcript_20984/g.42844 Transcript_20984/m.42844 type:complete len:513 (+) Transcript_20984:104-1642(+)